MGRQLLIASDIASTPQPRLPTRTAVSAQPSTTPSATPESQFTRAQTVRKKIRLGVALPTSADGDRTRLRILADVLCPLKAQAVILGDIAARRCSKSLPLRRDSCFSHVATEGPRAGHPPVLPARGT